MAKASGMRKAARRSAVRRPAQKSARRPRKVSARTRPAARKTKQGARRHRFVANHLDASAFEGGLRSYAQYRDLSIADATGGMVRAHVIKMIPPCDPALVSKRHYHDVEFQMIYVLKGWIKGEYEGHGIVTMREGSCWLQPPRIKHAVLDYSDDCELLEIILPADFKTVELE
jgi:mannose-6-phosphate isomerase-like protein (cupin superfamily)